MPFDDVWQIRPCEVTTAVAARWAGVIPQQKNRPAGRVLPAVQNQNPPSRKRHVKRAIFLFNHTNFTIFCMRP